MVQTPARSISLEEFLALPETKPASEYIDGEIIQKPMPQGKHSRLQIKVPQSINDQLEPARIAMAFPELRCSFAGRSIVPDVAVFVWDRVPVDENEEIANTFSIAPDWTIEILSPEQSATKVTKKILHCLQNGCQMGWLVDPDEASVFVYQPKQEPAFFDLDAPEERLPVPEFADDFQLTVGTLFGWLKAPKPTA